MSDAKKGDKAPCWKIPKEKHPCYGLRHSEEQKQKWREMKLGQPNNHLKRPILQLNKLTEEVIAEWPSGRDAARDLFNNPKHQGAISSCCTGKLPSAYGFKWRFKV